MCDIFYVFSVFLMWLPHEPKKKKKKKLKWKRKENKKNKANEWNEMKTVTKERQSIQHETELSPSSSHRKEICVEYINFGFWMKFYSLLYIWTFLFSQYLNICSINRIWYGLGIEVGNRIRSRSQRKVILLYGCFSWCCW